MGIFDDDVMDDDDNYPKIGPGYSDDISVVSDMTTPTVMTRQQVAEEEHYKEVNGGPGAPAFAWINPRHLQTIQQPLSGWMGHAAPFDFDRGYVPAEGARRMVCGTPQILSLCALDTALELWDEVDLPLLWAKSRALTRFFIEAAEDKCAGHGMQLASPREDVLRGSHVSFDLAGHGFEVMQALAARGVIGDFRAPATMRFGFAPLYLSYANVLSAVDQLKEILETQEWDNDRFRVRGAVT